MISSKISKRTMLVGPFLERVLATIARVILICNTRKKELRSKFGSRRLLLEASLGELVQGQNKCGSRSITVLCTSPNVALIVINEFLIALVLSRLPLKTVYSQEKCINVDNM